MDQLNELSNSNLSELYIHLDRLYKSDGLGLNFENATGDEKNGQSRFVVIFKRIKQKLCGSEEIQLIINENKNYNRTELAIVLADVITANFTDLHFSAIPIALIITHHSLFEICK